MFTFESVRVALSNLGRRKLRSFLTMLGMIFGVGAVIAMLSIGAGAERESLRIIENFGIRNIIIQAKEFKPEELRQIRTESLGLTLRDIEALAAVLRPKPLVSAKRVVKTFQVVSEKGRSDSRVLGVSSSYPAIHNLSLLQGAFFLPFDEDTANQVCVLGITAKQKLFGFGDVVGKEIKVNDQWLAVIGVLADSNVEKPEFEGVKIQNPNNDIYIPITTSILISVLLSAILNIVMGAIASISLLVGGIGIMNIMLASVLERTTEIGLRRAIGARKRDIRLQFIAEALGLSLAGGLVGIALGYAISLGVAAYSGWSTIITVASIGLSFGVSSLVGLIFGIYPAVQASNLDPIECLRYE